MVLWKKSQLCLMERLVALEDLRSSIMSQPRTQKPPKTPCVTKKLTAAESGSTFPSPKGHIPRPLGSTWADPPTAADLAGVAAEATVGIAGAAEVAIIMVEEIAGAVAVMGDDRLPRIIAVDRGETTGRDQDRIHLVVTDSIWGPSGGGESYISRNIKK